MPAQHLALADMTPVWVRAAAVVSAATDESGAIDLSGYEGLVTFVWTTGAITGTLDPKLEHCDTSGGSYADITGATASQVTTANQVRSITIDTRNVKRYVKAVSVVGTTSCALSVCMLAQKKVTG